VHLLLGHDRELAQWAAARIPYMGADADFGPCAALGVVVAGPLTRLAISVFLTPVLYAPAARPDDRLQI
jgi:hypothetical protein